MDYDTLDQSPDDTADRVIQFLGGIHKEKRAATNSSKLAHDHSRCGGCKSVLLLFFGGTTELASIACWKCALCSQH